MPAAADAEDGIPEMEQLELERRKLELEKLRVEIAQAAAPWWTRPGYIGSLVPIILALVGFFSAMAAGFFDRERAQLETEVDALTLKRDQLLASNAEIQNRIDAAYVWLRVASSEAAYAISHISEDPRRAEIIASVRAGLPKLPPDEAAAVGELLSLTELSDEIVEATKESLDQLRDVLKTIPASPWAVELQPMPTGAIAPGRALLQAPDGRFYDPAEGRYYTEEQLRE